MGYKNIHLLPTNKPSRLRYNLSNVLVLTKEFYRDYSKQVNQHTYITDDSEIKKGDYCLYNKNHNSKNPKWELVKCGLIEREEMHPISDGRLLLWMVKIIMTTDQDLVKDGVQQIDDEFLEWFVKNPSCESVEIKKGSYNLSPMEEMLEKEYVPKGTFDTYKIIIPQEEPKQELERGITITHVDNQETLRKKLWDTINIIQQDEKLMEAATSRSNEIVDLGDNFQGGFCQGFIEGAVWQAKRLFSADDLKDFGKFCSEYDYRCFGKKSQEELLKIWSEEKK